MIVDDARMSQRELVEGSYVPAKHPHAICDHKAKHNQSPGCNDLSKRSTSNKCDALRRVDVKRSTVRGGYGRDDDFRVG